MKRRLQHANILAIYGLKVLKKIIIQKHSPNLSEYAQYPCVSVSQRRPNSEAPSKENVWFGPIHSVCRRRHFE